MSVRFIKMSEKKIYKALLSGCGCRQEIDTANQVWAYAPRKCLQCGQSVITKIVLVEIVGELNGN